MKITSGRIRNVGINPNRGMSLGFAGLGQMDTSGLQIQTDANGNVIPTAVTSGSFTVSPATNVDTSSLNASQDLLSALTAQDYAAAVQNAQAPTSSIPTWLPWAAGGLLLFLIVAQGKKR